MAELDQEKTEQPSSRKREQARQDGSFAVSKELSSFLVVLGGLTILYFSGVWMITSAADFMKRSFALRPAELTVRDIGGMFKDVSYRFFLITAPVFFIPVIGALSYAMQNGFAFTGKGITPQFSKLDPIAGVKKLFSMNSVVELVKSLVKISVLSYVVYTVISKEWPTLPFLMDMDVVTSMTYIGRISFRIMTKTAWVLAVIAVLDYVYQKWSFEKSLRMTKEEIKEEMKELEGDPIVKARIKSIQREMARKRMMQEVPKSDVVVTNPTHIAVALKYDREKAGAPVVVAKGAGHIAEKIKEIARKHGVPVVENKPIARNLFRYAEIGAEIPVALYKAVAEILAYVYRLKGKYGK
ncbi:MAG: flagellar biosynthesis protein FlhB [Deltaproteobacteria bacterium]